MTAAEICENCGREYARPTEGWDWSPVCSIQCNGAARFREGGWTITQALQVAHPDVVVRMVRNVADAQKFEAALKALVQSMNGKNRGRNEEDSSQKIGSTSADV